MPRLRIRLTNSEFTLTKQTTRLGAASDNDIVINSDALSDYHAHFTWDDVRNKHVLIILVEQPSVTINDTLVTDSSILNDGDVICFGKILNITFYQTENKEEATRYSGHLAKSSNTLSNSQKHIGCQYCFHTINTRSTNPLLRSAVLGSDGNYYHDKCFKQMNSLFSATLVNIPPIHPLRATKLKPKKIGLEVDNNLNDKPIGISESQITFKELSPKRFAIRNNMTAKNLIVSIPIPQVPWLNIAVQPLPSFDGKVWIRPGQDIIVSLYPHLIRPSKQRFRLSFSSDSYLIIGSNGIDWITSLAFVTLLVVLFFSLLSLLLFTFSFSFFVNPSITTNFILLILKYFVYSAFAFALPAYLAPSWMLWLSRKAVNKIGRIKACMKFTKHFLKVIDKWLFSPGLLSHESGNISSLILFSLAWGGVTAIPWTLVTIATLLLSQVIPIVGVVFIIAAFLIGLFFVYRIMDGFGYLKSSGISNRDYMHSINSLRIRQNESEK